MQNVIHNFILFYGKCSEYETFKRPIFLVLHSIKFLPPTATEERSFSKMRLTAKPLLRGETLRPSPHSQRKGHLSGSQ